MSAEHFALNLGVGAGVNKIDVSIGKAYRQKVLVGYICHSKGVETGIVENSFGIAVGDRKFLQHARM